MRHARKDYDRFQDPLNKIPFEEPVILLRGQDPDAADTVRDYADRIEKRGATPEMVAICRQHADEMDKWPIKKIVADL